MGERLGVGDYARRQAEEALRRIQVVAGVMMGVNQHSVARPDGLKSDVVQPQVKKK